MTGRGDIEAACQRLRAGGLVAFPTETVYGLGADALSEDAVRRVFALKGRPSNNPLIVHVSGVEMARRVVAAWPPEAEALARAFWPGPLTLVLPKAPGVPGIVSGHGPNVGVRCPDHALALALIEALGGPIVGPSANPSGAVSPTTAAHVRECFSPDDVLVLDGGACRVGVESTVLSLVGERPRILRPGALGSAELGRAAGRTVDEPVAGGNVPDAGAPLESPGLLSRHYAPRTPATLIPKSLWGLACGRRSDRRCAAVVVSDVTAPPHWRLFRLPGDAMGYARGLYAALHQADAEGVAEILIEEPPRGEPGSAEAGLWRAVHDRLARAAERHA
jgi:L-threonylcarbamoyladenylate synthase